MFWFGIVEDRDDPIQMERVRVRIFGYHSSDRSNLPTQNLPWAQIISPVISGSNSGIGYSGISIPLGTKVLGMFLDEDEGQIPIILGTIPTVHLQSNVELIDGFSEFVAKNAFIPEQEQFETLPVEVLYTLIVPGDSPVIVNKIPEPFPRKEYIDKSSVSKIAIENTENKHPHVQRKEKPIEEGGLIDTEIPIATVDEDKFEVIPERSTNSNKAEFIQFSETLRFSTNTPSTIQTFSSAKKQLKDSNNKCVYTDKVKNYSDKKLNQEILNSIQEFLNKVYEENPWLNDLRNT